MKCDVLILAGLWNSGPDHWQSHWQGRYPKWTKAEHRDWNCPERDEWVAELDAAIAACKGAPILVAHSLGCMLVAHWAASGSPLKHPGPEPRRGFRRTIAVHLFPRAEAR